MQGQLSKNIFKKIIFGLLLNIALHAAFRGNKKNVATSNFNFDELKCKFRKSTIHCEKKF